MKRSFEQFSEEDGPIKPEPESDSEISPETKPEERKDAEQEKSEGMKQKIEELKRRIEEVGGKEQSTEVEEESPEVKKARIKQYQERYLPDYLREKPGIISRAINYFGAERSKFKLEGKENLPEKGPFIVICNHFGWGGDAEAMVKTFKNYDLHLAVGKGTMWDSFFFTKWFCKGIRAIPVKESLANISEKEKEDALKRQWFWQKRVFRKVIDREKQGSVAVNFEFAQQAVATLLRGDALGIFPEGMWLHPEGLLKNREKAEMKKAYRGIELIANYYKRLTGEDLHIIPTAFIEDKATGKKKLVIDKPLLLKENNTGESGTDWCMTHVAKMLPEEQRGYYKGLSLE